MTALTSIRRLSWKLRVLDRVVGPLQAGRVHVIGARPACGKTTFAMGWLDQHASRVVEEFKKPYGEGRFWQMPRRLAVFLTERSPEIARLSWAALRLRYDVDAVASETWDDLPVGAEGDVGREMDWIRWVEHNGWVRFYDVSRPTVERVGNALADEAAKYGVCPEIVLFDYIQRIRPQGRQNKFEAVAEAAHLFQTLAVELDVIVIVMSQLKRKGDGVFDKYRPPNLEDFKLSGDIEEVADVALGFFRPLQKMTAKDERSVRSGETDLEDFKVHDVMAIKVVKHRWRGPANDKILWVRHRDGRVEDLSPEPPPGAGDLWEPEDQEKIPF